MTATATATTTTAPAPRATTESDDATDRWATRRARVLAERVWRWTDADADDPRTRHDSGCGCGCGYWYAPGARCHGTYSTYCNWACRCAECRRACADQTATARAARNERVARPTSQFVGELLATTKFRHGSSNAYAAGCRCRECAGAVTDRRHRREERRRALLVEVDGYLVTTAETLHGHGHYATYRDWLCRCVPCQRANLARARRGRARRAANELNRLRIAHQREFGLTTPATPTVEENA